VAEPIEIAVGMAELEPIRREAPGEVFLGELHECFWVVFGRFI
jgi:hypothetical protein